MFATVVHNLTSPENTGMILRTHVAFSGERFVMVGPEPWRFKKRTQAFSRRLEKVCNITYLPDDDSLFDWCRAERFTPVAIEIAENPVLLPSFRFPERPAIIVGHEGQGLSDAFLQRCSHVATITQFGPVGCLNVAVSCSIAIYELNRCRPLERAIDGHVFAVALRCLEKRWLKVLWRMWQNHTAYDESKYLKAIQQHGSFVWQSLQNQTAAPSPACE